MIDAQLTLGRGGATRQVVLADHLDTDLEEAAHEAAYDWIKRLRGAIVEGTTFRDRFTARRDSLWWFTELYLHKTQVVLQVQRTLAALTRLFDREGPSAIAEVGTTSPIVLQAISAFSGARGIECQAGVRPVTWLKRLAALDARARVLHLSALASRERWSGAPVRSKPRLAAFIHRAFWRANESGGAAESYVGPILAELESRLGSDAIQYVGVGPPANFRVHRPLRARSGAKTVVPVERFASRATLSESRAIWRRRYADFRSLTQAAEMREAARIQGVECWPIIREQLAGVAWLQWPWSARAMDEAAAALDALDPHGVVTYAEAGGWGRALLLEARRRGVPSIGLQHGFIYRHWLNYRHEPDEMRPGGTAGFPRPTRTLLFDDYAARHLTQKGNFPPESIRVTGSPGLDALSSEIAGIGPQQVNRLRAELGMAPAEALALIATKEREARASLGAFLDSAGRIREAVMVIKPHPAESADAYAGYLAGRPNVRIARDGASLALLLAAARAVITVNSTVALDAGALGIPALTIGLPNNLSPFVDAGAIAGSVDPAAVPTLLERILYDESFRQQLADRRRTVFGEPSLKGPRGSASRSAEAIIEIMSGGGPA